MAAPLQTSATGRVKSPTKKLQKVDDQKKCSFCAHKISELFLYCCEKNKSTLPYIDIMAPTRSTRAKKFAEWDEKPVKGMLYIVFGVIQKTHG